MIQINTTNSQIILNLQTNYINIGYTGLMIQGNHRILQRLYQQKSMRFSRALRKNAIFETKPVYLDSNDKKVDLEYEFNTGKLLENNERSDMKKMKKVLQMNIQDRNRTMRDIRKQKRLARIGEEEKVVEGQKEEKIKQSLAQLILDEETGLPFEQGFDELILSLKEKKKSKEQSLYLQKINEILRQLQVSSEEELTLMYSRAIAQATASDYVAKAQALIVKQLIGCLQRQKQKNGKEGDEQIVDAFMKRREGDQEYVMAEYEQMEDNLDFEKYVRDSVKEESLQQMAIEMGREEVEKKARHSQQVHSSLRQENALGEDMYLGYDNVIKVDPLNDISYSGESSDQFYYDMAIRGKDQSEEVEQMDQTQFQLHSIYNKIRRRYFKQKTRYLDTLQEEKQGELGEEGRGIKVAREDFFDMDWTQHYLDNNSKYQQMVNQPSLTNIYENVDYLIEGMDESHLIKQRIVNDQLNNNLSFKPSFVGRQLYTQHLSWEGFRNNFDNLTNSHYIRKDYKSEARHSLNETREEFMRDRNLNDHQLQQILKKSKTNNRDINSLNYLLQMEGGVGKNQIIQGEEDVLDTVNRQEQTFEREEKKQEADSEHDGFTRYRGEKPTQLDLEQHQQNELEVYHSVTSTPFFTHHLTNSFRYFAERNTQISHLISNNLLLTPEIAKKQEIQHIQTQKYKQMFIQMKEEQVKQDKKEKNAGHGFGKGTRKRCNCLAVVKEGNGKIRVNGLQFIEYFPITHLRLSILKPVEVARKSGQIDIDFHIRGGGTTAQPEAARLALAKALVQKFPECKYELKHTSNLYADPRQVERKKQGLLKARKRPPYIRR